MALYAQIINHSSFKSMLEREKLSGTNFNDWFHQLRIVLRDEKKLNVIEQPIPPAPVVGALNIELEDCNALYDVHNDVSCLMLGAKQAFEQKTAGFRSGIQEVMTFKAFTA
nr:hypothetical protein [Tanacetum cinerariifolium]